MAKNVSHPSGTTAAVMFSVEMPNGQLWDRLVAGESHVDLRRYRRGQVGKVEWDSIQGACEQWTKCHLFVDDSSDVTVVDIRSRSRRLQAELARKGITLGLVVVDYLQLMSVALGRGSNREQEIASISRGLKGLSKAMGLPVLALSQLNRAVDARTDKRPLLSDLRESGAIEQDADTVIFLYRPGYYLQLEDKPDDTNGKTEAIVAKQRNGPTGKSLLKWWPGETSFTDWNP